MPFLNKTIATTTPLLAPGDVRIWTYSDPCFFYSRRLNRVFVILAGSITDGMSIPRLLRSALTGVGKGLFEGGLHDGLYHETVVELHQDGHLSIPNLSKEDKDTLLDEALTDNGEFTKEEIFAIFEGVNWGGENALIGDLKLTIPHIPPHISLPDGVAWPIAA